MAVVFEATDLTPTEKLVALALADHASDDGRNVYPGYSRLTRKTSLAKSTVGENIHSLISKGWIAIERKATPTKPSKFRFLITELPREGVPPAGTVRAAPQGGVYRQPVEGVPPALHKPSLTIIESSVLKLHPSAPVPPDPDETPVDLAAVKERNKELKRYDARFRGDPA